MNQKDAVYELVKRLKPDKVDSEVAVKLDKKEKQIVQRQLFDGFRQGRISYGDGTKPLPSDDALKTYIQGLVSNWLRKDRRLNGDTTYHPQRSSSRQDIPLVSVADPVTVRTLSKLSGFPQGEVQVFVVRRSPGNATAQNKISPEEVSSASTSE